MKCHLRCHLSESFTSLPIWITLFPFLLWSPCLGLQKLCHIIVGRVGTLVLFLILEEMLSLFTIENSVCCGFVVYCFYYVEVMQQQFPSMPTFWRVFIIKGCWNLSNAFSESFEMIIWFLSFSLLTGYIPLIEEHILKNACIPGINPLRSWCMM